MNAINFKKRFDGFMNVLSGLALPGTFNGSYGAYRGGIRSHNELCELYLTNGLAQKIIDRPSDDSIQKGVEIEGDEEDLMNDEYDRLQVLAKLANALRWSRLLGGAVMLLIAKDGGELIDPLDLNNLDTIEEIRVYDVTSIRPTSIFYDNADDPTTFGKMEVYELLPPGVASVLVHESRLILVGGEPIPTRFMFINTSLSRMPWIGRSALEPCVKDILRYQEGLEWSLKLLERKQQAVYNMDGLAEMMNAGDDDMVRKRINLVDLVRNSLNSVVVDKDDSYTVLSPGMEGVDTTLKEYQTALSASSNIPLMILFGEHARGIGNSGAGNLESYYGMVAHIQSVIARPALERITAILWVQRNLKSKIPDKWKLNFNPLWIATDLEIAQTELADSQANAAEVVMLVSLMDNAIMSPEEIRQVVVDKYYQEYGFSTEIPDGLENVNYAEGVDPSLMDVPTDPGNDKSGETKN